MADALFDAPHDTLAWEEVLAWQAAQRNGFVERLRATSAHYARTLTGAPRTFDADSWSDLPFTDKEDLRSAQHNPTSTARLGDLQGVSDDKLVQVVATSGTTGVPVFFGLTESDLATWRHSVGNMWFTAGIRPGTAVALTTAMPMVAGGLPFADGVRATGASLVWLGGQTPARMATMMDLLRIDTVIGTASFLTFFAERCAELLGRPATTLHVRTVIGGGEPGTGQPEIRAGISQAWGAERVSEIMGICDVMAGLWGECPAGNGMHFTAARNVAVELIDPDTGAPVAWDTGGYGEAVYTTFTREATPLLRFRSRDQMLVTGRSCSCGRTSPTVRCVGRTDDMLIYKAMNVFPSAIRDVVLDTLTAGAIGPVRIRKHNREQVRFDAPIPVEIESTSRLTPDQERSLSEQVEAAVRERLRIRVAPEIVPPGTIPVSEYKNALTYVSPARTAVGVPS